MVGPLEGLHTVWSCAEFGEFWRSELLWVSSCVPQLSSLSSCSTPVDYDFWVNWALSLEHCLQLFPQLQGPQLEGVSNDSAYSIVRDRIGASQVVVTHAFKLCWPPSHKLTHKQTCVWVTFPISPMTHELSHSNIDPNFVCSKCQGLQSRSAFTATSFDACLTAEGTWLFYVFGVWLSAGLATRIFKPKRKNMWHCPGMEG